MVWIQFIACLVIIVIAGTSLAKYGDLIAEKTGLGRVWIGVVLLAAITSLPELATGISSVTIVGNPDLTMGDLFGSNLINLVIIAIIDVVHKNGPVLHFLSNGIILSSVLSLFMIGAAATFLFLAQNLLTVSLFGRIGIYSLVLFGLYLLAQYMISSFNRAEMKKAEAGKQTDQNQHSASMKKGLTIFIISALATVGAGTWLALIGDQVVEATGLSASFVGTLLLAFCTSSPEIVVSISAARIGALDMAIGNVIGSNIFNMGVIIFVNDIFYTKGPILQGVDMNHLITALFAILMSAVVIVGIVFRPRFKGRIWIGADTVAIVMLYAAAITTLYFLSK
jgi:cation:H+ antiporter